MLAIIRTRWHTRPLSPRAKRRSSAAPGSLRKKYAGILTPQRWCAPLIILPHLEITESRYKMLRPLKYQIPSQVGETNQAVLAEPELGWLRAEISKVGQNTFSTSPTL